VIPPSLPCCPPLLIPAVISSFPLRRKSASVLLLAPALFSFPPWSPFFLLFAARNASSIIFHPSLSPPFFSQFRTSNSYSRPPPLLPFSPPVPEVLYAAILSAVEKFCVPSLLFVFARRPLFCGFLSIKLIRFFFSNEPLRRVFFLHSWLLRELAALVYVYLSFVRRSPRASPPRVSLIGTRVAFTPVYPCTFLLRLISSQIFLMPLPLCVYVRIFFFRECTVLYFHLVRVTGNASFATLLLPLFTSSTFLGISLVFVFQLPCPPSRLFGSLS